MFLESETTEDEEYWIGLVRVSTTWYDGSPIAPDLIPLDYRGNRCPFLRNSQIEYEKCNRDNSFICEREPNSGESQKRISIHHFHVTQIPISGGEGVMRMTETGDCGFKLKALL